MEEKDDGASFFLTDIPLDKDGFPVAGYVVRLYRKRKRWTQEDLARKLGVTKLMVRLMETKNSGLDSIERRRVLCKLLDIPPVLLGLASLAQIEQVISAQNKEEKHAPALILDSSPTSPNTYKAILQQYIKSHVTWSGLSLLGEIELIIQRLHEQTKQTTNKQEKKNLLYELWEFHRLAVKVYSDDKFNLAQAIQHLNDALSVALELQDANLLAVTYAHLAGIELKEGQIYLAKPNIDAALSHMKNASGVVRCDVFGIAANIYHAGAKDLADIVSASKFLDQSQSIFADMTRDERYVPHTIDAMRCQQTLFDSCLELGKITDTMEILDRMEEKTPKSYIRKKALLYYFRARCYLRLHYPDMALQHLNVSLRIMQDIGAKRNVEEIRDVYQQIRNGPYGNNPEVIDLGVALQKL